MKTGYLHIGFVRCPVIVHRGFEGNHPWYELEHELRIKAERNEIARAESADTHRALGALRDSIVAEETAKTAGAHEARGPIPKTARLKGIRETRKTERDLGREEYAQGNSNMPAKPLRPKPTGIPRFHNSILEILEVATSDLDQESES